MYFINKYAILRTASLLFLYKIYTIFLPNQTSVWWHGKFNNQTLPPFAQTTMLDVAQDSSLSVVIHWVPCLFSGTQCKLWLLLQSSWLSPSLRTLLVPWSSLPHCESYCSNVKLIKHNHACITNTPCRYTPTYNTVHAHQFLVIL